MSITIPIYLMWVCRTRKSILSLVMYVLLQARTPCVDFGSSAQVLSQKSKYLA